MAMAIKTHLMLFAIFQTPPPCTLVPITSDQDSILVLKLLALKGYKILLVYCKKRVANELFKKAVHEMIDWESFQGDGHWKWEQSTSYKVVQSPQRFE